ncbi:MAG: hypothetical protein ACT4P5_14015 [Armatimonadota bacterium]
MNHNEDGKTVVEVEAGERTVGQELEQLGNTLLALAHNPTATDVVYDAGIREVIRDLTELLAYLGEAGHGGE